MELGKKGMYYAMDAFLAGMLLLGVSVLLLQTPFYESDVEQKSFITQDMLSILSELKIVEVNSSFIDDEIAHKLSNDFMSYDSPNWFIYNNQIEVKKSCNNWYNFPEETYKFFQYLNSCIPSY